MAADRFGLGWRPELAAGIFSNLDRIDLVELIADDHYRTSTEALRALRTLSTQVPVTLHGVAMGLASTVPVEISRTDAMARLVDALQPQSWSEHLAFVRGGGIEIGHLAAPPRTDRSVEATIRNIETVTAITGSAPLLENIATLIGPPASTLDEAEWVTRIVEGSGAGLLLDLHNLYANALNFGVAPGDLLMRFPLHRVMAVHLSGGEWIAEPRVEVESSAVSPHASREPGKRLLDDHYHDVPDDVFRMLSLVAQHAPQPLDVIIERDGRYPHFDVLVAQLDAARRAVTRGRARSTLRHAA